MNDFQPTSPVFQGPGPGPSTGVVGGLGSPAATSLPQVSPGPGVLGSVSTQFQPGATQPQFISSSSIPGQQQQVWPLTVINHYFFCIDRGGKIIGPSSKRTHSFQQLMLLRSYNHNERMTNAVRFCLSSCDKALTVNVIA